MENDIRYAANIGHSHSNDSPQLGMFLLEYPPEVNKECPAAADVPEKRIDKLHPG